MSVLPELRSAPVFPDQAFDRIIIAPVFNDFESADCLLQDLERALEAEGHQRSLVLLVNDGSSDRCPPQLLKNRAVKVAMLHLRTNLGHQRAIAVALGFVSSWVPADAAVVVMDGDGEDHPKDINSLLRVLKANPDKIVVANRARRQESFGFRLGYGLYRALFRLLTGQTIRHGNFSAMSGRTCTRLAHLSSLWNHYAATLYISRIPIIGVELDRGSRYAGMSKMNLVSLIVHGLSAISVHIEKAGVRMLLGAFLISTLAGAVAVGVSIVRLFTDWAIPGWASIVGSSFLVLAVLSLISSVQLIFIVLAARERRPVIPAVDSGLFIEAVES